jgi:hypothetical protein
MCADDSGGLAVSQFELEWFGSVLGGLWGLSGLRFSLWMAVLTLELKHPVHEVAE